MSDVQETAVCRCGDSCDHCRWERHDMCTTCQYEPAPAVPPQEALWLVESSEADSFTTPQSNVATAIHGLLCSCNDPEKCKLRPNVTGDEWSEDYEDGWIIAKRVPPTAQPIPRERLLEDALRGLLDGIDDYWATLPEGKSAIEAARAALEREE